VVLQAKVLGRRSMAYEKLDDLDRALADHEKVELLYTHPLPPAGVVVSSTSCMAE